MSEPSYIAIEGVIGVGKTSLAQLLSEKLNGRLVLENPEENPFLDSFYKDPRHYAFQTQLFFLLSRFKQQQELPEPDFFHRLLIADYLFAKDRIFAYINLSEAEIALYEKVMALMEVRIRKPDVVVYLQSSTERLMRNIRQRNRPYEKDISEAYLRTLNEAYNHFFFHYDDTPLLIVNATAIDYVANPDHLEALMKEIRRDEVGTRYYNPVEP
ncbi:deoxynucleoside kinase [candidate division KSB1 bacterium]|nr:MAG: deoxynucleoside kinase [candidate division KSB1 bacterium]RPH96924.1 MAG: deoxynucleoside kinase [candidate division KSB1 bacterium]